VNDDANNLDPAIRQHYAAQSLSPAAMRRMHTVIAANRSQPVLWRGLGVAAAMALVIGTMLQVSRVSSPEHRTWALAREIASQHAGPFQPQVIADDFAGLRSMTQVGFTPIEPQRCKQDDYRVTGARYQSVAGAKAAQIRLAYVYGPPATLYEMPAERFDWLKEGTLNVDGTPVAFWREGNVLMAMAGTASDPNNSRD
jgi:hypothetical protein